MKSHHKQKKDDAVKNIMSPSATRLISEGQSTKFNDLLVAKLRKSRLPHKETQQVLEEEGVELADNFVADVRRRVEKRNRSWSEENGVIYFTVVSDGTTGEDWITKLEVSEKRLSYYGKQLLLSEKFKPTSGVTYNVAILKGEIFSDSDRHSLNIRAEAKRRKFSTPPAELACLIRQKFTDADIEAMGLRWIIAMHEPIEDSGGYPGLLGTYRAYDYTLDAYCDFPGIRWYHRGGFAFLVSHSSSD